MDEKLKPVLRNKLQVDLEGIVVQEGVIIRTVHNGRLDLLNSVRTPPPDLILEDRASNVEPEILDVSDLVVSSTSTENILQFIPLSRIRYIRIISDILRPVGRRFSLELWLGVVEPSAKADSVSTSSGHKIQRNTSGVLLNIRTTDGDVDLFKHIIVIVGRRRACGRRVSDVDTVHRPGVVVTIPT